MQDPAKALSLAIQGRAYFDSGEYKTAIEYYNRSINLGLLESDRKYAALTERAAAKMKLRLNESARPDLEEVTRLKPNRAKAFANLGIVENKLELYAKAVITLTKAIELDPKYAPAFSQRGFAYELQEKYGEALRDYQMAFNLEPSNTTYQKQINELEIEIAKLSNPKTPRRP